jgi:hypothetical protein
MATNSGRQSFPPALGITWARGRRRSPRRKSVNETRVGGVLHAKGEVGASKGDRDYESIVD